MEAKKREQKKQANLCLKQTSSKRLEKAENSLCATRNNQADKECCGGVYRTEADTNKPGETTMNPKPKSKPRRHIQSQMKSLTRSAPRQDRPRTS
jgi:hypothetical protein